MTLWVCISDIATSGADAIGHAADWFVGLLVGMDAETRRQVAFSMALIALSAKMAKADGVVTADEVAAFRRMFAVPASEEKNVRRIFDLAKRDVAGYESYARQVAAFYADDPHGREDVLDGLFAIAKADGAVHEREMAYLADVAAIFGIEERCFERIVARHVVPEEGDPYAILGIGREQPIAEIRARYRALAAENHPDRMIGRGVPPQAAAIAHERMAAINLAWQRIQIERR